MKYLDASFRWHDSRSSHLLKKKFIYFFLLLLFTNAFAMTESTIDSYPFSSPQQANRFAVITQELRCVVCQNQNLADSNAPLAKDMRQKIYQMILNNESDTDIKNYFLNRYGDFILLNPRLNQLTSPLWFFPFFAFAFVGIIFWRLFR